MRGENSLGSSDTTKSDAATGSTGGETFSPPLSCDVSMRGAVNTGLSVKRVKITVAEGCLRCGRSGVCMANTGAWRTSGSVSLA